MNTKNIPPLVMSLAGLCASIVMARKHYELHIFVVILLIVLVCFYVVGCLTAFLFRKFGIEITDMKEKEKQEQLEAERIALEEKEAEKARQKAQQEEPKDGSVIEKM